MYIVQLKCGLGDDLCAVQSHDCSIAVTIKDNVLFLVIMRWDAARTTVKTYVWKTVASPQCARTPRRSGYHPRKCTLYTAAPVSVVHNYEPSV